MSWERRARGGLYYTRSRRENGRVVREYVGTGLAAERAAAEDLARREKAETHHRHAATWLEQEASLAELLAAASELARQTLNDAGYHQHHRSEWRKRRGQKAG